MLTDQRHLTIEAALQDVHARAADKSANEGMTRAIKKFFRRANLKNNAGVHHHHFVSEGQRLGLVVSHVDHRVTKALVDFLKLRTQLPFEMRIDNRERFIKKDRAHVGAN